MRYLPLLVDVSGRRCVVAGGGEIAARQCEALLGADARVLLVAADPCASLERHVASGAIEHVASGWSVASLDGATLVIVATGDAVLDTRYARAARERGVPVHVVARPTDGDTILPAVVDRDPVVVAMIKEPDADSRAVGADGSRERGEVFLVGAGPGDPDLLTLRALRLMQLADVVLYDRLVADPILALCPVGAELIYVGKRRADHAMPQETINRTLIEHARAGKRVLRLKGGDPFIFGRGGEEIETLAEHGIRFQVVPGITAAAGCASYAGIPLTHRDYAQSCVFITGHVKSGELDLCWGALVQPGQTIVCYMGLVGLPLISRQLIAHGMAPRTPAALVERGTTSAQRVHVGTIASLPDLVARAGVVAPTLIIIGEVVRLREKLAWF